MKSFTVMMKEPVLLRMADGRIITLTYVRHPSLARGRLRLEIDAPQDVRILRTAIPTPEMPDNAQEG